MSALPNASIAITKTPAAKAFQSALKTYASSLPGSAQYNNALTSAWAGGELFAAAAKKAKLGPNSSPAAVKRGLYGLKNETLRGMAPPLTFKRGKPTFVRCYFVQKVKNGKLVPLYGTKPACIPKSKVAALLQALGG